MLSFFAYGRSLHLITKHDGTTYNLCPFYPAQRSIGAFKEKLANDKGSAFTSRSDHQNYKIQSGRNLEKVVAKNKRKLSSRNWPSLTKRLQYFIGAFVGQQTIVAESWSFIPSFGNHQFGNN